MYLSIVNFSGHEIKIVVVVVVVASDRQHGPQQQTGSTLGGHVFARRRGQREIL